MAIQKINLGTEPLGEGGDTYRSANTKINENFSNKDHAASRIVGTASGNLMEVGAFGLGTPISLPAGTNIEEYNWRTGFYLADNTSIVPSNIRNGYSGWFYITAIKHNHLNLVLYITKFGSHETYVFRRFANNWQYPELVYSSRNTKKDSNSNLILESGDTIPSNSAASKLVGKDNGRVPLVEDVMYANLRTTTSNGSNASVMDFNELEGGTKYFVASASANGPNTGTTGSDNRHIVTTSCSIMTTRREQWSTPYLNGNPRLFYRNETNNGFNPWVEFYTTGNTTIGTNKEIVTSSPVVRVFSDKIEAIHEAKDLPLEFVRNSEGDYTLKGTTGLRNGQNDWKIIIPKDDHDNQLIAFTLDEDADGTIHLKTYKRTFSMETFTFGPDLNTPLDIPEGRWVDLHFNDIPQEELDEPEPEPEIEIEA